MKQLFFIALIIISLSLSLYGKGEDKETIKNQINNAATKLKKGKDPKQIKPIAEIKKELKKEMDNKEKEIKEKNRDEKKYKYKLTPSNCNPIKNNKSVKVLEITDFEYVFNNNRRFWISGGSLKGIKKGMKITVCKNTGSFRLYPIAKAEISEVWDDKSIATLNDMHRDTEELFPDNPYYLAKGDLIVFTETSEITYDPAWFKKKTKRKSKKKVPPPEYRKEFFPEFREELLKSKTDTKTKKKKKVKI